MPYLLSDVWNSDSISHPFLKKQIQIKQYMENDRRQEEEERKIAKPSSYFREEEDNYRKSIPSPSLFHKNDEMMIQLMMNYQIMHKQLREIEKGNFLKTVNISINFIILILIVIIFIVLLNKVIGK